MIDVENADELREVRTKKAPATLTPKERFTHQQKHKPLRGWYGTCAQAHKRDEPCRRAQCEESEMLLPKVEMDYFFMLRNR